MNTFRATPPHLLKSALHKGFDEVKLMKDLTSCHCEQSEAIHFVECNSLHQNICRPEFISGPIQCGIEKLNLKDKFFALLAGKMLKQVQHDTFTCHCEHSEAIQKTTESRGVKCQ